MFILETLVAKKGGGFFTKALGGKKSRPRREVQPLDGRKWEVLKFEEHSQHKWAVVSFTENDLRGQHMADALSTEFKSLIYHLDEDRIVVDFSNVEHLTSSEIGAIMHFINKSQEENVLVAFCCLRPDVEKALDLFNVGEMVDIFDTRRDALALMDKPKKPWYWPFD